MKTQITAIIVIVLICATIGLGIYWSHHIVESSYNEAIALFRLNIEKIMDINEATM